MVAGNPFAILYVSRPLATVTVANYIAFAGCRPCRGAPMCFLLTRVAAKGDNHGFNRTGSLSVITPASKDVREIDSRQKSFKVMESLCFASIFCARSTQIFLICAPKLRRRTHVGHRVFVSDSQMFRACEMPIEVRCSRHERVRFRLTTAQE